MTKVELKGDAEQAKRLRSLIARLFAAEIEVERDQRRASTYILSIPDLRPCLEEFVDGYTAKFPDILSLADK